MSKENNNDSLQKAHGAMQHIARIAKACGSFHEEMGKLHKSHLDKVNALHKAHHDDLQSALGKLAKTLGVENTFSEGGSAIGEPASAGTPAVSGGTPNIQDFGKAAGISEGMTKEQVEATVADTITKVLTAVLGKAEGGKKPEESSSSSSSSSKKAKKAAKPTDSSSSSSSSSSKSAAKGIGSRHKVAPVTRVSPVFKAMEGMPNNAAAPAAATQATQAEREALVLKAANGDTEAILQLMKGAQPAELPNTLMEPLSKIH